MPIAATIRSQTAVMLAVNGSDTAMTPLISEMVRMAPHPEQATWFDLGHMSSTESQRVEADLVMHLPFDRTALCGIDKNGEKFALWLAAGNGSVAVGGCTSTGRYLSPFAYVSTPEGIRYYRGESEISESEVKQMFRMTVACLLALSDCTDAYQPTIKSNSPTNARRIAKGKPPLIYDWHTVILEPSRPASEPQGGTHATPRRHQCRGHWRNCKSGKRVWVKDCWKGDASKGTVFKDYKAQRLDDSKGIYE